MYATSIPCGGIFAALLLFSTPVVAEDASPDRPSATEADLRFATYERHLAAILTLGFERGRRGLREADSEIKKARQQYPDNSRLEYAYGVVLMKHFKRTEAMGQFEAVTTNGRSVYLPAWQALIRTRLLSKKYDAAFKDAEALAKLVRNRSVSWTDPDAPRDAAFWLGRMVAACLLATVDAKTSPQLADLDAMFQGLEDASLEKKYKAGRHAVELQHQKLVEGLERERVRLERKQQSKRQKQQKRIEKKQKEIEDKEVTVKRSTKEWRAWLDEQLDRNDKELDRLQKDYEVLDTAAVRTSNIIARLQREIARAQLAEQFTNPKERERRDDSFLSPGLQLGVEANKYQNQYMTLSDQAQDVMAQAKATLVNREAVISQYNKATGLLVKDDAALQKRKKLLRSEERRVGKECRSRWSPYH